MERNRGPEPGETGDEQRSMKVSFEVEAGEKGEDLMGGEILS